MGTSVSDHRSLATDYRPLARKLAGRMAGFRPELRDELNSVADLALVEAAARFDPARGVGFGTFVKPWIWGRLRDFLKRELPIGYRGFHARRRNGPPPATVRQEPREAEAECHGRVVGPTPDAPVGSELETAEEFERLCRKVPRRHGQLLRLLYRDGLSQVAAARELGVSQSRACYLLREALAMLRADPSLRATA
jgi:RNA polymerase sigma factor (sigma-70 family)